jgi:hypothetical protein
MKKKQTTTNTRQRSGSDRETVKYADQSVSSGTGGETHQAANGDRPVLTTQQITDEGG